MGNPRVFPGVPGPVPKNTHTRDGGYGFCSGSVHLDPGVTRTHTHSAGYGFNCQMDTQNDLAAVYTRRLTQWGECEVDGVNVVVGASTTRRNETERT